MSSNYKYKEIGYDLMFMLSQNITNKSYRDINRNGVYQTLVFDNNFSIKFSKWRQGTMPFYLMLYNDKGRYIFELDLSMLVEDGDKYFWNLKVPSNIKTKNKLVELFGAQVKFDSKYTEFVTALKKNIDSGINTPRNGFLFVNNESWDSLCGKLLKLIIAIIETHNGSISETEIKYQANNDNGFISQSVTSRQRKGQRLFRKNLMVLYEGQCAISCYYPSEALEAVHIMNHSLSGINHTDNGIILRADLHLLFDFNLLKIEPESYKVVMSYELKDTPYWKFNGIKIKKRIDGSYPSDKYLREKWNSSLET